MQKIEPLNDYILLKVDKEGEKAEGGLLIAHSEGDKTEAIAIKATIIHLPKEVIEMKGQGGIKEGDRVLVAKWEGQHAKIGADHYLFIKYKDVLGKII